MCGTPLPNSRDYLGPGSEMSLRPATHHPTQTKLYMTYHNVGKVWTGCASYPMKWPHGTLYGASMVGPLLYHKFSMVALFYGSYDCIYYYPP